MAGGFDEKAGGAQMGVMQGPMVSQIQYDPPLCVCFFFNNKLFCSLSTLWAQVKLKLLILPSQASIKSLQTPGLILSGVFFFYPFSSLTIK